MKEIFRLKKMLDDAGIPCVTRSVFGGYQIIYPNEAEWICDAIQHILSCGHQCNLLEIMGLLTPEELIKDSVLGYQTAEEVFDRIKKDWDERSKNDGE